MKNYKLLIDMSLILPRLKKFRLGDFNSLTAIIFVDANNADDACGLAWERFTKMVFKQDDSTDTALLLRDIKEDFVVKKAYVP